VEGERISRELEIQLVFVPGHGNHSCLYCKQEAAAAPADLDLAAVVMMDVVAADLADQKGFFLWWRWR
jgi:hypothetical protein